MSVLVRMVPIGYALCLHNTAVTSTAIVTIRQVIYTSEGFSGAIIDQRYTTVGENSCKMTIRQLGYTGSTTLQKKRVAFNPAIGLSQLQVHYPTVCIRCLIIL